jgi:hypothetical protein
VRIERVIEFVCPFKKNKSSPVLTFQTLVSPLNEDVSSLLSSLLIHTRLTPKVCAYNLKIFYPEFISQIITVISSDPVTSFLLSLKRASDVI